jgi:hypothetical protein
MKSNILLEGEIGSGKTRALCTLLPEYIDERGTVRKGAGLTPLVVTLEPGIAATLGRNLCSADAPPDPAIHHHYLKPLDVEWSVVQKYARLINTLPLEAVLKVNDPDKPKYSQFLDLFDICADFICDGCGQSFGPLDRLSADTHAIAFDSLTGLTTVARHNAVGGKPILSQPEYNPVMDMIENFLKLWWGQTLCTAILLAHVDREPNIVTGFHSITVHTIGQKLAPRIVKIPDEIIMAERDDRGHYSWSTDIPGTILKSRRLPRESGLLPDFAQLFKD